MKRALIIALLLTLVISVQVFAQHFDLPEPVFVESTAAPEVLAEASFVYLPAVAVFDLPDFADVAYLWAFNPGDAAEEIDFTSVATLVAAASSDAGGIIPNSIRNNQYFRESVRLKQMAQSSFDSGDYDASANYAAESLRYAQLSDEYVALQLKIREADDAIKQAKDRMAWAVSRGIDKTYPDQYNRAQASYTEATTAREAEDWETAIKAARNVLYVLGDAQDVLPLPAQYTVRTWQGEKDCLWNIAGYSWVYGDPTKWKVLYEANKSKMPQPNNPDLIHPGMVLDIPSIKGETRQGMWQSGRTYAPLPRK